MPSLLRFTEIQLASEVWKWPNCSCWKIWWRLPIDCLEIPSPTSGLKAKPWLKPALRSHSPTRSPTADPLTFPAAFSWRFHAAGERKGSAWLPLLPLTRQACQLAVSHRDQQPWRTRHSFYYPLLPSHPPQLFSQLKRQEGMEETECVWMIGCLCVSACLCFCVSFVCVYMCACANVCVGMLGCPCMCWLPLLSEPVPENNFCLCLQATAC